MRAIFINAAERSVSEIEVDGSLKNLQCIVGGRIVSVCSVELMETGHCCCYVNRDRSFDDPRNNFFMMGGQQLAGNGVILKITEDGSDAPCELPLDWVSERIWFLPKVEQKQPISTRILK